MAISTATATAPKLKYDSVEEYRKKLLATKADNPATGAVEFFKGAATGSTPAMSAAIAANREALSRQAGTMRSQAAQTLAGGGALGQGQAIRGTQETERNILQGLADSRNKELQTLGQSQESANRLLLDQGDKASSNTLQAIQSGLSSESPAMKQASLRALTGFLESQGVQMGTQESAEALDAFMGKQAEEDPLYQAQKLQAKAALQTEEIAKINQGAGSLGSKIGQVAAMGAGSQAGTLMTNQINGSRQEDTNFWNNVLLPKAQAGQDISGMADKYISARNSGLNPQDAERAALGLAGLGTGPVRNSGGIRL